MSALKVGELWAELGIDDDKFNKKLKSSEKDFYDTGRAMDRMPSPRLDLDSLPLHKGLADAESDSRRTVADIDAMNPRLNGSRLGSGLKDGLGQAEGIASSGATKIGGLLTAGIAGGLAVGGAMAWDAFEESFERRASSAKLDVRLGVSPAFAGAAGQVAGELYGEGFGESFVEVGDQVESVTSALGGVGTVGAAEFKETVKTSMALSDILRSDVTPAAAALVKAGMAKDLKQAMDMLLVGFQRGGKSADDFVNTFGQKSQVFNEFGLTGEQAIGGVLQSLDKGATSADFFTGALEELKGNAGDSADVFTSLGFNGQQMAADLSGSGPAAANALTALLARLREIEDPATKSTAIVGLFGEESTAMQTALLAIDPSQANARLGEFEGAAGRATKAMDPSPIEAWKRSVNENVVNFMETSVIPVLDRVGDKFHELFGDDAGASLRHASDQLNTNSFLSDNAEGIFKGVFGVMGPLSGLLGFDSGGVIPGPIGQPRLIMAHAGETVLPTHKSSGGSTMVETRGPRTRGRPSTTNLYLNNRVVARVQQRADHSQR